MSKKEKAIKRIKSQPDDYTFVEMGTLPGDFGYDINNNMKTLITAHSGAFSTEDNSMEFVRRALSEEVEALEVDVRINSDGVLLLSHDELTEGHQVTLEEVFREIAPRGGVKINCDLKEENLERPVFDLAMECGLSKRLIFSGTVSGERYVDLNAEDRAEVFLNIEEYIEDLYDKCKEDASYIRIAVSDMCDICLSYGINCINMNYNLATDEAFEIANKKGIALSIWTVNEAGEIKKFIDKGAGNVTTRRPDLAK